MDAAVKTNPSENQPARKSSGQKVDFRPGPLRKNTLKKTSA